MENEKLICRVCGKSCTPDDYDEFQEMCLECADKELKSELSAHYDHIYETMFENMLNI
jgi:hypothetical protein